MNRQLAHLKQTLQGVWFPAALFSFAGFALAIAAYFMGWLIPPEVSKALGTDSTGTILQILATSMLAVTTFSLTTMVSTYATATQTGTPRSIQLLVADRTSRNALSTFIGAFAFSIVGIVAQSTNAYSPGGQTFLLLGTITVIIIVLITLLRWISFLTTFGRMADIIDRVEQAASQAMHTYTNNPLLGAHAWITPPTSAVPIMCDKSGFIINVDIRALQEIAEKENCMLWINRRIGSRLYVGQPVAYLSTNIPQHSRADIRRAFTIAEHRTFNQDPRLGLIALSEIASRALSPAVNDPGTAIEILSATHRILSIALHAAPKPTKSAPLIYMRPITPQDLIQDALRPISRDGASTVEVAMRIQKEIGTLISQANPEWAAALRTQAIDSMHRAQRTMQHPSDIEQLKNLHAKTLASQPTHANNTH